FSFSVSISFFTLMNQCENEGTGAPEAQNMASKGATAYRIARTLLIVFRQYPQAFELRFVVLYPQLGVVLFYQLSHLFNRRQAVGLAGIERGNAFFLVVFGIVADVTGDQHITCLFKL